MRLTILWGEKGLENDDAIDSLSLADAQSKLMLPFPHGQLAQVSLFSRCHEDAEVQKLYEEQKSSARPHFSVPLAVTLEKVELDGPHPLTWKEHQQCAAHLGGCLPKRSDLITASIGSDAPDVWIPVL